MANTIAIDDNKCISCILKPLNYLFGGHKCFVYSCKRTNLICTVSYKFSTFKLVCCALGFISGVIAIYKFTLDLLKEDLVSMMDIYLKFSLISAGFLAIGNSFLWNVKTKEFKEAILIYLHLDNVTPYPIEENQITYKKVFRSAVCYWFTLVIFIILNFLDFMILGLNFIYYRIFAFIFLNLFTCVFLELRFVLDLDLELKTKYKIYLEKILKIQVDNGIPGKYIEDLKTFQILYMQLIKILERFQDYISLILPYCFVTFVPTLTSYVCVLLETIIRFKNVPKEVPLAMIVLYAVYGIPGFGMAGHVVKTCDKLAFFVSTFSLDFNETQCTSLLCKFIKDYNT